MRQRPLVALLLAAACGIVLCESNQLSATHGRGLKVLPPYVRGAGYQYILSEAARENGMSYLSSAARLRVVLDKLKRGIPIRLTTVGASIMSGQGTFGGGSLPQYIFEWFADRFPGLVNATNGAMPGTTSQYLSVCHNMHVPSDTDLLIVDFTISDGYHHRSREPFLNEPRSAFERLVRKLLNYPNRPAILLIHAFAWNQNVILKDPNVRDGIKIPGKFWNNAERDYGEFERYYHLPSVSVKGCCYHYLHDDLEGFIKLPRRSNDGVNDGSRFYFDDVHPDEKTGCRVYAELLYHLIDKVYKGLEERPLTDQERAAVAATLPEPMIPGNYEATSTRCFIGSAFTSSVQGPHDGWEWVNESKGERPKYGFVATAVGAAIRFLVDTRANVKNSTDGNQVLMQLSYLRSYEGMGAAQVTCGGGCSCQPTLLQGHHSDRNSLAFLHDVYATMAADCALVVTVLGETLSGGHKVKLLGLVVSDEAGVPRAQVFHGGSVEYIGAVSMHGMGGTFDIRNHV